MSFVYKNPLTAIVTQGPQSVKRTQTFGNSYSVNNIGGYMEVYTLNDLLYTIPSGTTGIVEYSGNTIPVDFYKGNGNPWSYNVLSLGSDNISSGRRRLGMLVYVYEQDQVYQFHISGYTSLWTAATASTNCVNISDFGTTIKNNTVAGQNFINAWTASTIEDVSGYTSETAVWRKFSSGTSGGTGGSGFTSVRINNVSQFTSSPNNYINFSGVNITITSAGTNTLVFSAGTGGGSGSSNLQYFITGSTPSGLTINSGDRWFDTNTGVEVVYINDGDSSQWVRPSNGMVPLFTGNTSATCITSLYVSNIYGCSPININDLVIANSGITTNGLTATTISATTYFNLPTDVRVTGSTYSNNTFTFTNNTGGTFNVLFNTVTGLTVNGVLTVTGNTSLQSLTANTISATTYQNLPQSISGTGTENYLSKWTGSTGLVDSTIYDDGTFVGINTTSPGYGEAVSIQTSNKGVLIDDTYVIQTAGGSLAFASRYDYSTWGSGSAEIAIGARGPLSRSTGNGNIGIGDKALLENITGNNNIAIGATMTLGSNVGGNSNIGIGMDALIINIEGGDNIAIGEESLRNNTSGNTNIAIGKFAGYSNLNDNGNVYIGYSAGYSNNGGNNIFIGYSAGYGDTSSNYWLNIGETIFGSLSGKTIGINKANPTATLDVGGTLKVSSGLTVNGNITTTGTTTLGNGTFTKAGFATGDILLDNNSTDTPGVLFYYANNSNYGIDSWNGSFDVLSGQLVRVTNKLNETGGAVKMAIDTSGNMVVTGFIKPNAWRAGQVVNDIMLSNTEVTISTTTIATSTSDTDFLTYSYTPLSTSSYIVIHYHLASYSFEGGTGNDSYFSRIKVDGSEITYSRQSTVNGNRTGVLFPLTGRYTNSSVTAKSIVVACRRDSADDSITIVNSSSSMWLRITEIAR
jgi:hypothetical protein